MVDLNVSLDANDRAWETFCLSFLNSSAKSSDPGARQNFFSASLV